jgi:hypothetical protein
MAGWWRGGAGIARRRDGGGASRPSRKHQAKMMMNQSLIKRNPRSDLDASTCILPVAASLQWRSLVQSIQILLLVSLPLVPVTFNLLNCNIPKLAWNHCISHPV